MYLHLCRNIIALNADSLSLLLFPVDESVFVFRIFQLLLTKLASKKAQTVEQMAMYLVLKVAMHRMLASSSTRKDGRTK